MAEPSRKTARSRVATPLSGLPLTDTQLTR
jgi:hypothetical protein